MCSALKQETWLEDKRFNNVKEMYRNRTEFQNLVQKIIGNMTFEEISERLDEQGITYGIVQKMADVLDDQQLRAADIIIETGDSTGDYNLTINSPINVKEAEKKKPVRAPNVGADSLEVLRLLEFEEDYIQELVSSDVIVAG